MRILSREEVMQVVEMQAIIDKVKEVYTLRSEGRTEVWPTSFYEFEAGKADMDIKSGYLKDTKIFGHKTVSWFGENKAKGLPDLSAMISIFDATTGLPIGVLDGAYITGVRTGAAGAIGAKYLARPESENLVVLGSGNQATFQIAATLTLFPNLKNVFVVNALSFDDAKSFVNNLPKRLTEELKVDISKVNIEAREDLDKTVSEADIIITVTPSRKPVIKKEWVKAGTHFSCIGSDAEGKEEIEPEIFSGAKIFVDDTAHCIEAGEIEIPLKQGIIKEEDIVSEIGDLILGRVSGRTSEDEITIYDATGMAVLDLAVGKAVLDLAESKGIGTDIKLY